jgi:hypothetical protein
VDRMELRGTGFVPSSSASSASKEDIRGLNDDKKDVYAEAKSDGFDVKILR